MKKVLLATMAALFVSVAAMAADRYPSVTIKSKRNFEIVVDGRTYRDDNFRLERLHRGMHTIKVYERGRGIFGRTRMVSSKNFYVRNNDIRITIDRNGYVDIDQLNYGRGRSWDNDDRDWGRGNDRDRNYRDRNDRDWDYNRRY
jgi:hypothetical protein